MMENINFFVFLLIWLKFNQKTKLGLDVNDVLSQLVAVFC